MDHAPNPRNTPDAPHPPAERPYPPAPPAERPYASPSTSYGPYPPYEMKQSASRARRLLTPLATLAGIAAAFTYVGLVDPNESGHYPPCPLYSLTGLYCPGCGGLRGAHALAHGDPLTALGDNAPAFLGYGIFAVVWVIWVVRAGKGLPLRITQRPLWWWSLGVVLMAFTVVRNLPFGAWLAP
ncbi:DUF2752 domain-containing protein [Streptomyces sp. NPDC096310]|uniref:DUF2752 domain-containing protein n=1 Tax=Streptomyces sp. NPDC096310 TaxID=3366082 RepID=UPI00380CFB82